MGFDGYVVTSGLGPSILHAWKQDGLETQTILLVVSQEIQLVHY